MYYRIFATIQVPIHREWLDVDAISETKAKEIALEAIREKVGHNGIIDVDDITLISNIGTYYKGISSMERVNDNVYFPTEGFTS